MSRSAFSIRKLINNPNRPSDPGDSDDETFECSSAKIIRTQVEVEQHRLPQDQSASRRQHHQSHFLSPSPWAHSHQSTDKSGPKRIPKPIAIVRQPAQGVAAQASTGRRNSTPHASSSTPTGRISPAPPLSARTLGEMAPPFHGAQHSQREPLDHDRRTSYAVMPSQNSQHPDWVHPLKVPSLSSLMRKASHEGFPSQELIMGQSNTAEQRGHRDERSSQSSATTIIHHGTDQAKTPSLTKSDPGANLSVGTHSDEREYPSSQFKFVDSVPSSPSDLQNKARASRQGSSADATPIPEHASPGSTTWFLSDPDEGGSGISDCVQQLMWEADEAFQAASLAWGDTRRGSHSSTPPMEPQDQPQSFIQAAKASHRRTQSDQVHPLQNPSAVINQKAGPTPQSQLTTPISPMAGAGRGPVTAGKSNKVSPPATPSPHILRSPSRGTPIAKTNRGSRSPKPRTPRSVSYDSSPPPRKDMAGSPPKSASLTRHQQHSYQRSFSRLNLAADRVTDKLFDGRSGRFGFHKIEADEVITAEQVQQFREVRLAKAEAEAIAEARAEAKRVVSCDLVRDRTSSNSGGHLEHSEPGVPADQNAVDSAHPQFGTGQSTPKASELRKAIMDNSPPTASEISTEAAGAGQSFLATPPATPPQLAATSSASPTVIPAPTAECSDSARQMNTGIYPRPYRRPSHSRSNSSLSHIPLPTIPEVRMTAPQADEIIRQSQKQGRRTSEQSDDLTPRASSYPFFQDGGEHVYIMSTPFTAVQPSFQHGRIRLAKADLSTTGTINSLEAKLLTSPDETMDWVAFQMAILGGAGDMFGDPNDFLARDAQEDLADDLCDMLEDLGFSNGMLGSLKKTADAQRRPRKAAPATTRTAVSTTPESARRAFHSRGHSRNVSGETNRSSSPESRCSDEIPDNEVQDMVPVQDLPIPLVSEYGAKQPLNYITARKASTNGSSRGGIKRWTSGTRPKRYQGPAIDVNKANTLPVKKTGASPKPQRPRTPKSGRVGSLRESMASMPESPMPELVMITAADGSKEVVPMGYNLGHDLGDFLKWESEHAYASGFYGSD